MIENQPDLFPPYQKHSETSYKAAVEIHAKSGTLRRKVYDYLWAMDTVGATDDEIQVALGMNPSTQRPRRVELVDCGLVVDSGRKRKTRGKRDAVVWIAAVWTTNNAP